MAVPAVDGSNAALKEPVSAEMQAKASSAWKYSPTVTQVWIMPPGLMMLALQEVHPGLMSTIIPTVTV
jgi:hypothetical protein